jgi:hypothetical protein
VAISRFFPTAAGLILIQIFPIPAVPPGVMVAAQIAMTALDQGFDMGAMAVWIGAPEVGTIAARFFRSRGDNS